MAPLIAMPGGRYTLVRQKGAESRLPSGPACKGELVLMVFLGTESGRKLQPRHTAADPQLRQT